MEARWLLGPLWQDFFEQDIPLQLVKDAGELCPLHRFFWAMLACLAASAQQTPSSSM